MNRHSVSAIALIASLSLLAACGRGGGNQASSANATAGNATAGNTNTTQGQPGSTVSTAQDMAAGPVGLASASTLGSHNASAYVDNAAQSDMYEIQAGKIAEQKAKSPDVKAFARMMIRDHTKSTEILKAALAKSGLKITPPTSLDNRRQGLIDNLKQAGTNEFDKRYMDQQVQAHQEALALHQGYAKNGDNADLKAAAAKIVPVVQMHLQKAQAIDNALSGAGGGGGNATGR